MHPTRSRRRYLGRVAILVLLGACGASDDGRQAAAAPYGPALDSLMQHDLTAYFSRRAGAPVRISFAYLRRGATVTGIAYPKYYLWVVARDASGAQVLAEGAVRAAGVDTAVEVTHFLPATFIRSHPEGVDSVFPAGVVPEIRKHL